MSGNSSTTTYTSLTPLPDRGPIVLAVTLATLIIASIFVIARFISRIAIVKRISWDDGFIAIGWLLAFGLSFAIAYGTSVGLGENDDSILPEWTGRLRRCEYVFSVLYNPALMATKTSILIFYLRLSKDTQKDLRIASYITLVLVNVAGVVLTFLNAFQCRPVGTVFSSGIGSEGCIPLVTLYLASAPVNIITDLAILVLPIPVLTGMRLPQKQKNVLIFTFALGIFVTIVDVVRIYYLQQASTDVAPGSLVDTNPDQPNFSWYGSLSLMWTAVEVNVGIICACIPTLKPLVSKLLPVWIGHIPGNSGVHGRHDSHDTQSSHTPITQEEKIQLNGQGRASSLSPAGAHSNGQIAALDFITMPETMVPENHSGQSAVLDFVTTPSKRNSHTYDSQRRVSYTDQAIPKTHGAEGPDDVDFITTPNMPSNLHGDKEMGFKDFLNDSSLEPPIARTRTALTARTEDTVYFGFVNMKKPKVLMRCDARESVKYCTLVTTLFLLWGVSYGLLNSLNAQIAQISHINASQSFGLQSVYFGGYLIGPITVGRYVLTKWGFKTTFITGLCIYGTGTLMFWPSAVLISFPGFIVSGFVVGFGLSILETAANPFLALCGPSEYSEMRLLLAQGVQGIGTVVSQLLAQKALFHDVTSVGIGKGAGLIDVQWAYLAIALFDVILALFFYYMPLPEASDEDLQLQTMHDIPFTFRTPRTGNNSDTEDPVTHVGRYKLIYITLVLGVSSQFLYVAGQESISIYLEELLTIVSTPTTTAGDTSNTDAIPAGSSLALSSFNFLLIAHSAFAVARFLAAGLCYFVKPRFLFAASYLGCLLFSILIFSYHSSSSGGNEGNILAVFGILFFFFEGPLWPFIFAISLRGQGSNTKNAASLLTSAASGGAIFPWAIYALYNVGGKSLQYAFCILIVVTAAGMVYPAWLLGGAEIAGRGKGAEVKRVVDPKVDDFVCNTPQRGNRSDRRSVGIAGAEGEESTTSVRRLSRHVNAMFAKMRAGRKGSDVASVEHREVSREHSSAGKMAEGRTNSLAERIRPSSAVMDE